MLNLWLEEFGEFGTMGILAQCVKCFCGLLVGCGIQDDQMNCMVFRVYLHDDIRSIPA